MDTHEPRIIETPHGTRIVVGTQGKGPAVLFIPSLGRGVDDFDALALTVAAAGFQAIQPQPRGIGGSEGPPPVSLFDLAADVAAVISALGLGRAHLVGHAFGNRVARATAARFQPMAESVILLAGGGEVPIPPEVSAAIRGCLAEGRKPDAERLVDLRTAFFAKGADPSIWLRGWNSEAAAHQQAANRATPLGDWWRAGEARVLLVQASEDPVAPAGNAEALRRDIGGRLSLVTLAHASHAILPEQPAAVASVVTAWLSGQRDESALQAAADAALVEPASA
ncbi:MAG TPA: alpha/beta hydrolase [Caulobacteraceae bacterium]|jgi:pimeloyl-ACP methyl ester carboxylesterase